MNLRLLKMIYDHERWMVASVSADVVVVVVILCRNLVDFVGLLDINDGYGHDEGG